ncbi:MAG: hypothetical protein R3Y16_04865 [Rikenellaceae bacterium]
MKTRLFFAAITLFAISLQSEVVAQTSLDKADLSEPSLIAPDYFGPNAFPIPDMLDGTTLSDIKVELSSDYFGGHRGDTTYDIAMKCTLPLFSERVNLVLWVSAISEWYTMSEESREHSRLTEEVELKGQEFGDAYLSTDIHIMRQSKYRPDISLRMALKTALGYGFFKARYYDGPGYFFDASASKSLHLSGRFVDEIRFVGSLGFLCWQTDNGRQNDATMYGVQVKMSGPRYSFAQSFGGYSGWEKEGDCPMSVKSELRIRCGDFEPLCYFQYGIKDYPYTQFKIGLAYTFATRYYQK